MKGNHGAEGDLSCTGTTRLRLKASPKLAAAQIWEVFSVKWVEWGTLPVTDDLAVRLCSFALTPEVLRHRQMLFGDIGICMGELYVLFLLLEPTTALLRGGFARCTSGDIRSCRCITHEKVVGR